MLTRLSTILGTIGGVFIIAFIIWAFTQHATIGLYQVNGFFRWVFIGFGAFALLLLFLVFFIRRLKTQDKRMLTNWISGITLVLALPGILVPAAALYYTGGFFSGTADTPPRLLIADTTGVSNIPDMAVVFTTEKATANTLTWGPGDKLTTVTEEAPSKSHVFMLQDLQPDAGYSYRVNDGPAGSFFTPPAGGTLHFAVASDAHVGAETARSDLTADMLEGILDSAERFDMFFYLGDLVEYGFRENEWQEAFELFSPVTSEIPVTFAAGNHETLFSGFGNYLDYNYPEGMPAQSGSRLWHRYDIGDVHFFVLDLEWSAECYTTEQADWLEEQLAGVPVDDWKIVMSHCFYYASGLRQQGFNWYDNPETIGKLAPLFNQYGVDLVFSGHNHHIELLENSGVVYVLCGAFGGSPDSEATWISPSSLWRTETGYGFMDVTLAGDECTLIFRDSDLQNMKTYIFDKD